MLDGMQSAGMDAAVCPFSAIHGARERPSLGWERPCHGEREPNFTCRSREGARPIQREEAHSACRFFGRRRAGKL